MACGDTPCLEAVEDRPKAELEAALERRAVFGGRRVEDGSSVLAGHIIGNVLQTMIAIALLIGFRPTTEPVAWLAAAGLLMLIVFGITWLGVALGMVAKGVGSASNLPLPLLLLPFFGSGFVPTASMPEPLRAFADNQPFTPMIEAIRGLLLGTPVGNSVVLAVAWSIGLRLSVICGRCIGTSALRVGEGAAFCTSPFAM